MRVGRGEFEAAATVARVARAELEAQGVRGLLAFVDAALLVVAAAMGDLELFEATADELERWLGSDLTLGSDVIRDVLGLVERAASEARGRASEEQARRAEDLARMVAARGRTVGQLSKS